MYYGARYYNPSTGRFVSQDPIGFAAGDANLYRYVGNEATGATDPSGWKTIRRRSSGPFTVITVIGDDGSIETETYTALSSASGPVAPPKNGGARVATEADLQRQVDFLLEMERLGEMRGGWPRVVRDELDYRWGAHPKAHAEHLLRQQLAHTMEACADAAAAVVGGVSGRAPSRGSSPQATPSRGGRRNVPTPTIAKPSPHPPARPIFRPLELREQGKLVLLAELSVEGELTFHIKTAGTTVQGHTIFQRMMNHFGSNVKVIRGVWADTTNSPKNKNLGIVNRLTSEGITLDKAVKRAWTSEQAAHYGFNQISIGEGTKGTPGNYSCVEVRITK